MRLSTILEMAAFVGIVPESDGFTRAERLGVPITAGGIEGLMATPAFQDIKIVFDATSADAQAQHARSHDGQGQQAGRQLRHQIGAERQSVLFATKPIFEWP